MVDRGPAKRDRGLQVGAAGPKASRAFLTTAECHLGAGGDRQAGSEDEFMVIRPSASNRILDE
jgi:hypothetical protein